MPAEKFFFVLIFSIITQISNAQKAEKGSSPDNPWTSYPNYFKGQDSMRFHVSSNDYNLSFGKWSFYPEISFHHTSFLKEEEHSSFFVSSYHKYLVSIVDTISFSATGPDKNRFSCSFYFTDSFTKSFEIRVVVPKNEKYDFLTKSATGYIITSAGDSSFFDIVVPFQNNDTLFAKNSIIRCGNKEVVLKPVFEKNVKKFRETIGLYRGFNFLLNEQVIASVTIHDSISGLKYRYWLNPGLDANTSQSLASVIFVIVAFF